MTQYCCECSHSNIQIQLTPHLKNRLNQLKAPMGTRERQSRNLPTQKTWCNLWKTPIDPLEKACYKWTKTKPKIRTKSLLLTSPPYWKVES